MSEAQAGGRPLPAPVRGLPILGSALDLRDDTLGFLARIAREQRPMVTFRMGKQLWVLVTDPGAVDAVLRDRDGAFDKPDALYGPGRLIFSNALTGLKGVAWKRRRQVVAAAFHAQPLDAQAITQTTHKWAQRRLDQPQRLDIELRSLMTEIAFQPLIGRDARTVGHLAGPIGKGLEAWSQRNRVGIPLPDWAPIPMVLRMRRSVSAVNRHLDEIVERRVKRGGVMTGDLLDSLLPELGPRNTRDELAVAAGVGGHQMALAMTWTLLLLDGHPDASARMQDEVDELGNSNPSLDDLSNLVYGSWVIDESLRLYPPFFLIGREASRAAVVSGYRIPARTTVVLSPWISHRDPLYFDQPETFRPERWSNGFARTLPRGAYFPMGGGQRFCLAHGSLRKQMLLVLATLMKSYVVQLSKPRTPEPKATTSLEPRDGLTATLKTRCADDLHSSARESEFG